MRWMLRPTSFSTIMEQEGHLSMELGYLSLLPRRGMMTHWQCKSGFYPNTNPVQGCAECTVNSHCTNGQSCQNNVCVTTCSQDSDCSDTQTCTDGACQDVSCNLTCGANAQCTVSSHAAACACNTGFYANPDAATGCATCTEDSHCTGGQSCVSNQCVTTCSANSECADTETCTNNQCTAVRMLDFPPFQHNSPYIWPLFFRLPVT